MELSKMMVFCTKCGINTEQHFIGIEVYSCRIASRCLSCRSTNFSEPEKKPRVSARQQTQTCENINFAKPDATGESEWSEGNGEKYSEELEYGNGGSWDGINEEWKKAEKESPDSIY